MAASKTWQQANGSKCGINFVHVYQGRIKQTTCMFMWMHDLPYLPYSISAPMALCMKMWMHVRGI